MMEYIRSFIGGADDIANMMVYVLIVLLFLFGFVKCILPVMRNRATLNRATRAIKSGDKKRSWQEDGFLGKGPLLSHWSEYLNNLFFADGVYHNASNVEDYINEDTVIYGPGSSGFAEALPGLMVSLGFMGTLIGLATGLSGFDMGDESAIMGSIEVLIPSMRYAFMTSIVGVIFSVSFTIISRFVNGSASRAIVNFYGAMSRNAGVISVDPLTQVAIYQQEQTALIQTMAKDLNGQFTVNMTNAIREAVEPVNDSLTKFVTVNTQEQMRFLDTVVTRFVTHMDRALGNQFDALADVIDRTTRNQERLLTAMESHVTSITRGANELSRIERASADMMTRLDGYIGKLSASQRQLDDAYTKVTSNFEQMQVVSRQQADYLREISGMQNAISEAMESIRTMSDSVSGTVTALRQSCEGLERMKTDIVNAQNDSAKQLEETHREAVTQVNADIGEAFKAMSGYMEEYARRIGETAQSISASVESLPNAVSGSCEALIDQVERMNATLHRAQRAMDDVVDRMYGN